MGDCLNMLAITVLILSFLSIVTGDLVTAPPQIEDSRLKQIEFTFHQGRRCHLGNLEVKIAHAGQYASCTFEIPAGEGENIITLRNKPGCEDFRVNNRRKLPIVYIKSEMTRVTRNNCLWNCEQETRPNFCIKTIVAQSDNNDVFQGTYRREAKLHFDTNFGQTLSHSIGGEPYIPDISGATCPSQGCPYDQLLEGELRSDMDYMYCDFNPNCDKMSSNDPNARNSGRVCFETNIGQYDVYDYCCATGPGANMPGSTNRNSGNQGRNNQGRNNQGRNIQGRNNQGRNNLGRNNQGRNNQGRNHQRGINQGRNNQERFN